MEMNSNNEEEKKMRIHHIGYFVPKIKNALECFKHLGFHAESEIIYDNEEYQLMDYTELQHKRSYEEMILNFEIQKKQKKKNKINQKYFNFINNCNENENNEKKVQSLIEISTQINQNSRNILNELSEVEDIDQIKDLKEKLLNLTECYRQLIEEIF